MPAILPYPPAETHRVGVIGAGTMGAGIAHVAAAAGFETLIHDVSAGLLERGMARISADLDRGVARGKTSAGEASATLARISTHQALESLAPCTLVIEAVIEDAGVKGDIFRKLAPALSPEAILATNTSSLSVTSLAAGVPGPGRFVGLHFFNPPIAMKLVEVVRGDGTTQATVDAALAFVKRLDKVPVVASDSPGFIVNRVARPFYLEALRLMGEGVADPAQIDRIVRSAGGFRMGPFELMDLIGIDVNLAVTKSVFAQTFGEPRFRPHIIQQQMVDAGRLGRKSGRGFYEYGA